jgi:hypothetical protein
MGECLRPHFRREARRLGSLVATAHETNRIQEMLVQVIHELYGAVLHLTRDRDKVCHGQVLNQFAQAEAACMRENPNSELGCHEKDCEVFVDAADARRVDLDQVDRPRLQELLEKNPVLSVLTG